MDRKQSHANGTLHNSTPTVRPSHYQRYASTLFIIDSIDIQHSVTPPFLCHIDPKLKNKQPNQHASHGY